MNEIVEKNNGRKCCRCSESWNWKILLRNCNHVVCVGCGIDYLRVWIKEKQKARIKCPRKSCRLRIHENDVRALLDKNNPDLDHFLTREQRDWLLFHHDQDVIRYALGGWHLCRQCPLCLNFYAKVEGCNYVRCSNLRCNQWFCFVCGDPIDSWQHFAQNRCRVGWDDVFKLTYVLRFLIFVDTFLNLLLMPFLMVTILFILPFYVMLGFPFYFFKSILDSHRLKNGQTKKILLAFKMGISGLFVVPFGMLLGVTSLFTSIPLSLVYFGFSILKCVPPASHILKIVDLGSTALGLFGFGNWKQILKDAKAARNELEIEEMQKQLEKSERLKTGEMTSQQERERAAAEAAHEARKNRAIGAAQCGGGAIDVGRIIKKTVHNLDAIEKGQLGEIQMVNLSDVQMNNAAKVAGAVPKAKKMEKMAGFL